MAPASWHLPVGISLSAEVGYQRPEYSDQTWSVEVRPIIDKHGVSFTRHSTQH